MESKKQACKPKDTYPRWKIKFRINFLFQNTLLHHFYTFTSPQEADSPHPENSAHMPFILNTKLKFLLQRVSPNHKITMSLEAKSTALDAEFEMCVKFQIMPLKDVVSWSEAAPNLQVTRSAELQKIQPTCLSS